jgi:hypothetical protein
MVAAIALRGDCDSGQLRKLAKQSADADQVRRLLALAVVYGLTMRTFSRASRRRPTGGLAVDSSRLGA